MAGNSDDNDFDLQSVEDLAEIDLDDQAADLSSLSAKGRNFTIESVSDRRRLSPILLAVASVAVVGFGAMFFMGGDKSSAPIATPVMPEPIASNDAELPSDASPTSLTETGLSVAEPMHATSLNFDMPQPSAPTSLTTVAFRSADQLVDPVVAPAAAPVPPPEAALPSATIETPPVEMPATPPLAETASPLDNVNATLPAPTPAPAPVDAAVTPPVIAPVAEAMPAATPSATASAADVEKVLERALGDGSGVESLAANEFFDSANLPRLPDIAKPGDVMGVVSPMANPASGLVVVTKNAERDSTAALNTAGKRALDLGRYEAALDFYDQLYEKNPADASVLMGRAVALQNMGQVDEAASMYDQALAKDPNNPEILLNMLGLLKKQYPAVAYERLKMLRQDYPANALVAAQLGLAAAEAGDMEAGARNLQVAASLQPNNPQHYFNLGILYERAGKTRDAVLAYEKALEVDAIYGSGRDISREVIYDRLSRLRG
ncbi:MAG: tetratricopeptide repeat protein [Alphaproteobacteria bacterium]|nr:tetratricopeptide repeat protein [Alphaproteobacteria bacterium]